jgi:hypothetical protein
VPGPMEPSNRLVVRAHKARRPDLQGGWRAT